MRKAVMAWHQLLVVKQFLLVSSGADKFFFPHFLRLNGINGRGGTLNSQNPSSNKKIDAW